ncbi:MAG: hypothetical protein GQ582_08705 [Methyloprofundus sp.]|nr:hypothetical protein [Methyloprofundus sp.]
MTTIELDDVLVQKVLKIGHYQICTNDTILADYVQASQKKKTPFDELCCDLGMVDEDIDNLFKRDKDTGRTLDL